MGRKPGFVHILSTFFLDVDKKQARKERCRRQRSLICSIQAFKLFGRVGLHLLREVLVDVEGGFDILVTEAHLHRFGRNSGEEKLRAVRVPQRVVVEGGANGIRGSDAGYLAVLLHIPPAVDHTTAFLHGTRTDKGAVVIDVDHVDLRADAVGVECKWGDIVRGAACRGDILPLEIGTIGELCLPLVLPGTSEQRQRCAVQLDGAVTVVLRGSEIQLIRRAPAFLRRGIAASGKVVTKSS